MPVHHVIWNWNGTIFCDSGALIEATIDAFAAATLPEVTVARYQELHTQPIPAFYDRLAGRTLTGAEQRRLAELFHQAYGPRREACTLTQGAGAALARCRAAGLSQSLLSMYPHPQLTRLVDRTGIGAWFDRVDGLHVDEGADKVPHLRRHLDGLGRSAADLALIGDSVDDARAAAEVGARCVLYDGGLHSRTALRAEQVPVAGSLAEALDLLAVPPGPPG